MTPEEITRLLASSPPERRILHEVAVSFRLRANELRHLFIDPLDHDRGGLQLDASWTKNRRDGFQPLPRALLARVHSFAASGEPTRLYAEYRRRDRSDQDAPITPLLYVPSRPARALTQDLKRSGIP